MLQTDIFGAIFSALKVRKKDNLSQDELAARLGKDKSATSRLISKPGNWTIATIADVANSLDLDVEVVFNDKLNPCVKYTRIGAVYDFSGLDANGSVQNILPSSSNRRVDISHVAPNRPDTLTREKNLVQLPSSGGKTVNFPFPANNARGKLFGAEPIKGVGQ